MEPYVGIVVFELASQDSELKNFYREDIFLGLRVKMCVWLGVSRGLDLAFLNAD